MVLLIKMFASKNIFTFSYCCLYRSIHKQSPHKFNQLYQNIGTGQNYSVSSKCMDRILNQRPADITFIRNLEALKSHPIFTSVRNGRSGFKNDIHTSVKCFAGHSKWANIKHAKTANDNKRAAVRSSVSKRILATIRETGVSDPKSNLVLARLIAEAKSQDVPNSTIDKVIKSAATSKEELVTVEGKGPGGCWIVVQCLSQNSNVTKNDMRALFKSSGCRMGDPGCSAHVYECKGYIDVAINKEETLDMDNYVDVAIETGAEDVQLESYEDAESFLRFECNGNDINIVHTKLTKKGFQILDSVTEFIPNQYAELGEEDKKTIEKLLRKLESYHGTIEHIYINVELDEAES